MNAHKWLTWAVGDRLNDLSSVHFELNAPFGNAASVLLLAAVSCAVLFFCWPRLTGLSKFMRPFLSALRVLVVFLALFLLLDPCIVGDKITPTDRFVVMLFDDSQSMNVQNDDGQTRGERLQEAYANARTDFEERIANRYQIVKYRFGNGIDPLRNVSDLTFAQNSSDIAQAIHSSFEELNGTKIPAVVLFSDGVQHPPSNAIDLSEFASHGVPILTVGVDDGAQWRDMRIESMTVNHTNFDQSPIILHADVRSIGLSGKTAQAAVLHDNKIVQAQTFPIDGDDRSDRIRFEFIPSKAEWLQYDLRLRTFDESVASEDVQNGSVAAREERTPQNNTQPFLVDNTKNDYRILYYCSSPNWEQKFIRRALQEDEQLKLSSLVLLSRAERSFVFRGARTSLTNPLFEGFDTDEEKFGRYDEPIHLRLGLGETELVKGFPSEQEELFSFQALIVGDVDWDDFKPKQLQLIRDFVDLRGGSLLLLGGRDKFTSDAFQASPIYSMLPALPSDSSNSEENRIADFFSVGATPSGERSGAWSLSTNPIENQEQWTEMPFLYGFDVFDMIRPGATVYGRAYSPNDRIDRQPFFISHRYGNGKCAVIAVGETWPWRMRKPEETNQHERLWRQWIRSLVDDAPLAVEFLNVKDSYPIDEPIPLRIRMRNGKFEDWENSQASLTVTAPSNNDIPLALEESIHESGVYTCEWTPSETGKHVFRLDAPDDKTDETKTWIQAILVDANRAEFENAQFNKDFLTRLSSETGGQYFPLDRMVDIPNAIPWKKSEATVQERIHLWHYPFFYFLFVIALSLEWYLRRKHGHP